MLSRISSVVTRQGLIRVDKLKVGDELRSGEAQIRGRKSYNRILSISCSMLDECCKVSHMYQFNAKPFLCSPLLKVANPKHAVSSSFQEEDLNIDIDFYDHNHLPIKSKGCKLNWIEVNDLRFRTLMYSASWLTTKPSFVSSKQSISCYEEFYTFELDGDKTLICDDVVAQMN
jgi:hypothetical protein